MARNMKMELLTFSLILYQSKNCGHRIHVLFMEAASFLGQTTSYETEVQEREPWDFYEWITFLREDVKCAKNEVHELLFHVQIVKQVIYF
jgi:hypothetical protein